MNFSERTLNVLKNFSTINPSLVFKAGSVLKTISPTKTIVSIAKVDTEFPSEACVYDLSRFLSSYGLYQAPNIEFGKKNFVISDATRTGKYTYADASMVITPPEKEIKLPSVDVSVDIEWANLQDVIKASGVLQLPEIAFVGDEGSCYIKAIDSSNPSADTFGIKLGDTADTFQLIIKTENLKLIPQNYKVSLSSKGISKFEGTDIVYYIAIESKSTYTKGE